MAKVKARKAKTPKSRLVGIRIDIETRSGENIRETNTYRYCEHPDFAVLVIAYAPLRQFPGGAIGMGKPRALNLTDEAEVEKFKRIITDRRFQKHAYNANFERIALSRWLGMELGTYLDPENWRCSAVRANVHGVYGTLDEVAQAVRSPITKDPQGSALIRLFSSPDKKTGQYHEPDDCPCGQSHRASFEHFEWYCINDVLTEAAVASQFPEVEPEIQRQYEADQRINDRGILHRAELSLAAVEQVAVEKDRLMGRLKKLTGLDNPNSTQQLQGWLAEQGYPMASLNKESRAEALADPLIPEVVAKALELKGAASLSSVAKHQSALKHRGFDGRIRGSLRFYGAHTGREAGSGVQPQNLPRLEASDKDLKRLLKGKAKRDAPTIAKGSVRASLIPAPKHLFVVVDYNAIEARCLGWQSGETWVQEEFRGEGKIYEATAAMMFGVSKSAIIEARARCFECGSCEACVVRGKGKVSDLALGYAGGAGALVTMGAEDAGIDIGNFKDLKSEWVRIGSPGKFHEWERDLHDYPELLRLRDLYRDNRPATVRFWKQCEQAWDVTTMLGKPARFGDGDRFTMLRDGRHTRLVLPSGRSIWYRFAKSHADPDDPDRIDRRTYVGKGKTLGHTRIETFGGRLTENITQAVARDVLFNLIMEIERKSAEGWPARLVLHVHDEVVLEVRPKHAEQVLADVKGLMSVAPSWAPGLMVKGEGKIMDRYRK